MGESTLGIPPLLQSIAIETEVLHKGHPGSRLSLC